MKGIADLRGKVVVLAVAIDAGQTRWWDRLKALQEKYGAKGLVAVAVPWHLAGDATDSGRTTEDVEAEAKRTGLNVGLDAGLDAAPAGMARNSYARGATELMYGVRDRTGAGAVFLVDRKGILRGVLTSEDAAKRVEEALAGR